MANWEDAARQIRARYINTLKPHDKLPTENELVEILGFTKSAIRRALGHLQEQGALYPRQGAGYFVHVLKERREIRFRKNMETLGFHANILELIEGGFEKEIHDERVCAGFRCKPANGAFVAKILRKIEDRPAVLTFSYFPNTPDMHKNWESFKQTLSESGSITHTMRQFNVANFFRETTEILARNAGEDEAKLLLLTTDDIVIETAGCNIDTNGTPVEFTVSAFPARFWKLKSDHVALS